MKIDAQLQDALRDTWRATIELSNQCQLAHAHKKCAAHGVGRAVIMPRIVVNDILHGLARGGFNSTRKATLAYHCYNEPCIDPRLMQIICHATAVLPDVTQHIWTNGLYMTRELLAEMIEAGANRWTFSGYTEERADELREMSEGLKARIKIGHAWKNGLDGRNGGWADTVRDRTRPCGAPLGDMMHRASGNMTMCCYDCQETTVFGNLRTTPWREVLLSNLDRMRAMRTELKAGKRAADGLPQVCRHCKLGR